MTPDRNRGISIDFAEKRLNFLAVHPDLGSATWYIDTDVPATLVGRNVLINADYVLAGLNGHQTVKVTVPAREGQLIKFDDMYVMPMRK